MRRSPFEQRYQNIEVMDAGPIPEKNLEMLKQPRSVVLRKLKAEVDGKKERRSSGKISLIRPKNKPDAKRFVYRRNYKTKTS